MESPSPNSSSGTSFGGRTPLKGFSNRSEWSVARLCPYVTNVLTIGGAKSLRSASAFGCIAQEV